MRGTSFWQAVWCALGAALMLILATGPSFAYLDPGSGGMLIQGLIGFCASAFATVGLVVMRVRQRFRRQEKEILPPTPDEDL